MPDLIRTIRLFAMGFCLACSASAATLTVGSGGLCSHSTIGDAIAAADPGDVIVVADGTWSQGPLFVFKDLEIRSGIDQSCTSLTNGPAVLESATGARLFTVLAGEVVLQGLTLKNADLDSAPGGALYVSGDGTVVEIVDSLIDGNRALSGGGIYATNLAHVSLTDSELRVNTARKNDSPGGGGIHCSGGRIDILDVTFNGNRTTGKGGGIFSENCSLTLDGDEIGNTYVFYNHAQDGGGIYADNSTVNLGMEYLPEGAQPESATAGVRFAQNSATGSGGGLAAVNATTVNLGYTEFDSQNADVGGASIYINGSSIFGGSCRHEKSCIRLAYGDAPFGSEIYAVDSVVSLTRVAGERSQFAGPAVAGTFLWSQASDIRIGNSWYRGGLLDQDVGTVVDDRDSTHFELVSMTFVESSSGEPVINLSGTSGAAILRSVFWNNSGPIYDGDNVAPLYDSLFECNVVQSLVSLPGDHISSIVADPQFTDLYFERDEWRRDNYAFIGPGSPAIDYCTGTQHGLVNDLVDVTGYPRGIDGGRDAGAFETRWLVMSRYEGGDSSEWSSVTP